MTAVHDRAEIVEPLLLAWVFRDRKAFGQSLADRHGSEILEHIAQQHLLTPTAVAVGLEHLGKDARRLVDRKEPLHTALCDDADRWLVADGGHWSLRVDARAPGYEIVRWRGITMLLPPSIIVAGALAKARLLSPCCVEALPSSVAPQHAVGHLHVHLGPMLPFEALWGQLWSTFLQRGSLDAPLGNDGLCAIAPSAIPDLVASPRARQSGLRWQWLLELAFIARALLERRFEGGSEEIGDSLALRAFSRGDLELALRRRTLLALWANEPFSRWARRRARAALRARDETLRAEARRAERRIREGARRGQGSERSGSSGDDMLFVVRELRRCERVDASAGAGFDERLLYQYLRIKVALYSRLVVDPWTTGLRHFLDVVVRDTPYTEVIADKDGLRATRLSAARAERPLRIGPLEVHTQPQSWLDDAPSRDRTSDHAWILSFARSPRQSKEDADGVDGAEKWRRHAREQATRCRAIRRRIEARPSLLRRLRGVSLMDWERNGPVWLFEPHLRRLIEASRRVASEHPGRRLSPLRTAIHLGEDFDHQLTGLRQIAEPFAWGLIGRGDRIGHALALGLDPDVWAQKHPHVRVRPWDRILDAGFVAWAVADGAIRLDAEGLNSLRASAGECIAAVFRDCPGDALEGARHIWLELPVRGRPHGGATMSSLSDWARERIDDVRDSRRIGRRALGASVTVDSKVDLSVVRATHKFVHQTVADMHVAIEVNPSSNLLVGGFRSIFEQPVFHKTDLPIVLGADDPLTFATTLADDYAYAWASMVLMKEITAREATARLEEAARCSVRYSFSEDGDTDTRGG